MSRDEDQTLAPLAEDYAEDFMDRVSPHLGWLRAHIGGFERNAQLADELHQRVCYIALKKIDELRDHENVRGWLRTTARNLHMRDYKKRANNRAREDSYGAERLRQPLPTVEHQLSQHEAVDAALTRLPPKHQSVFYLHVIEGYSFDEIGEQLDIPKNTARSRYMNARRTLRRRLAVKALVLWLIPSAARAADYRAAEEALAFLLPDAPPLPRPPHRNVIARHAAGMLAVFITIFLASPLSDAQPNLPDIPATERHPSEAAPPPAPGVPDMAASPPSAPSSDEPGAPTPPPSAAAASDSTQAPPSPTAPGNTPKLPRDDAAPAESSFWLPDSWSFGTSPALSDRSAAPTDESSPLTDDEQDQAREETSAGSDTRPRSEGEEGIPATSEEPPATAECTGDITSASWREDTLHITGSLSCDAPIGRWTLVLDDTVIHEEHTPASEVAFDLDIDVSGGDFDDGGFSLSLWAGEGTLVDTEEVNNEACEGNLHRACHNDDVWWFECGAPQALADSCETDEVCMVTSATDATCATTESTCGDGVMAGDEECDSADLGGESCVDLGYEGGEISCDSDCRRVLTSCHECGDSLIGGDEECDDSDLGDQTCEDFGYEEGTLGCDADCGYDLSGCGCGTSDTTTYEDYCSGGERDIFTLDSSIAVALTEYGPRITATFAKCDSSPFGSEHNCHVRVGSWDGVHEASLSRVEFSWEAGTSTKTVSWDVWASSGDWLDAAELDEKEFYLICDEPGGDWNHWRTENAVTVEKTCP